MVHLCQANLVLEHLYSSAFASITPEFGENICITSEFCQYCQHYFPLLPPKSPITQRLCVTRTLLLPCIFVLLKQVAGLQQQDGMGWPNPANVSDAWTQEPGGLPDYFSEPLPQGGQERHGPNQAEVT